MSIPHQSGHVRKAARVYRVPLVSFRCTAVWVEMPPQPTREVIADFIPEADMRETMDGVDGRQQANDESAARQRLFLKRAGDPGHPDLRPRKRHRKSAYQWLVAVDNQV